MLDDSRHCRQKRNDFHALHEQSTPISISPLPWFPFNTVASSEIFSYVAGFTVVKAVVLVTGIDKCVFKGGGVGGRE